MNDRELVDFALAQWFELRLRDVEALSEFERQHLMDRMLYEREEDTLRQNLQRETLPWETGK